MRTRLAVLRRVVTGGVVMLALGVASSWIDPKPHRPPLTYYVRAVDLAALFGWCVYVLRTPCAGCGKPMGWRGLDRTGDLKCVHCGADSRREFSER